ncbi:Salicylic acid-binding protein 2 [Ananas comosus]|uniref:Salicylic acid-binding protein 2 n=1 Tax=Ananas comosus TaxID=4615 RepID=A0A199V0U3_ANACO|nr:Salicylic acid-binding protein 2 [Ananas comosus]
MENSKNNNTNKHVVLVHGAGQGAWCWYKVTTRLRLSGYRVTVPDLAASGIDPRQIDEVRTFAEYSEPLMEILRSLPDGERVIIVGHSLGGLNIALAMEKFPEKVAAAVFVTAFRPDWTSPPSSVYDELSKASGSYWMDTVFKSYSNRPTTMLFGPQFLKSRLYQLCSPEDVTLGTTLLRIGSLFIEDLKDQPPFSKNRYGSVNTVYIICAQDQAITVEYQRSMIAKSPVKEVKTIKNADHMAMLSTPEELSQYLMDIAEAYA